MTHKWSAEEGADIVAGFLSTNMGAAEACRKCDALPTMLGSWCRRSMGAGKRDLAGTGGDGGSDPAKAPARENESPRIVVGELTLANSAPRKSLELRRGWARPG